MKDYHYFKASELVCKCGKCDGGEMNYETMALIAQYRTILNVPLTISSAFRCPEYNLKVSDTGRNGEHTTGQAVDILIIPKLRYKMLELAFNLKFPRIGLGKNFIHLGTSKELPHPTWWTY